MNSLLGKMFYHSTYPYIISTLLGITGMFFYEDCIKGFIVFSYTFLITFIIILSLT